MEDKLQEAKELLNKNSYVVIKMTKEMNKDSEECARKMDIGEDKDCMGCSCNRCVVD